MSQDELEQKAVIYVHKPMSPTLIKKYNQTFFKRSCMMHLFRIIFKAQQVAPALNSERKKKNGKQTNPKYQSLNFGKSKCNVHSKKQD